MIIQVQATVLQCTACGKMWIPVKDLNPKRCPKPDCRKLATWDKGQVLPSASEMQRRMRERGSL